MTPRARYIAAVDQGTTNTKAVLLNCMGEIVHRASAPVAISFPQPAWVEQEATALWSGTRAVLESCFSACDPGAVAAIGIANQRESIVTWERQSGKPASPCISWQCRRSADICRQLRDRGQEGPVAAKTGLRLDPLFSASKLAWLLEQDGLRAAAERGDICGGTVDSWLLWKLTNGRAHACDVSNASRTLLFNLTDLKWDDELLSLFQVPRCMLPEVKPSKTFFGETAGSGGIPAGVPIFGMMGDSHAALFGHAAFETGMLKATYGTGSSLMTPVPQGTSRDNRISTTVAWGLDEGNTQFALEGNISASGAAVQWVGEFLRLKDPVRETSQLALEAPDSGGVVFVPALVGLGAPHWDERARASISGLTRGSSAAHLARAAIEAIAFQVRDAMDAMEQAGAMRIPVLLADGGAAANDQLMRIQADIIGRPVVRSSSPDLSAQGAGWMAGLGCGFWTSMDELAALPRGADRFEPRLNERERESRYEVWRQAVAKVLNGAH